MAIAQERRNISDINNSDGGVKAGSEPKPLLSDIIASLIVLIRSKKIEKFEPTFKPQLGLVYNDLESGTLEHQLELLSALEKEGIVVPRESISILKCSDCSSSFQCIGLSCQACGSSSIASGEVIEHIVCGNIDFHEKYLSEFGRLICRKCNKRLTAIGVDYSRPGLYYRCMSCKTLLPSAGESYSCLGCGRQSQRDELVMLSLPLYDVNHAQIAKHASGTGSYSRLLADALASIGIRAQTSAYIAGASKIQQKFAIVVYDSRSAGGRPIIIGDTTDMYSSSETAILSLFAKSIDVGVKQLVLFSAGTLEEKSRALASAYGISIVQVLAENPGLSLPEGIRKFSEIYSSHTSQKTGQQAGNQPSQAVAS